MKKTEVYNFIKLAGMLSLIPLILFSGPFGGYIIADILIKKLRFPDVLYLVFTAVGFLISVFEIVRITRIALKSKV